MKRVDAREFAEHAAEYLLSEEPITVEKDGEVIGRYEPAPHGANGTATNGHAANGRVSHRVEDTIRPESRETVERLNRTLQEVYKESGLTEDEFAAFFDLTKPFPYDAPTQTKS